MTPDCAYVLGNGNPCRCPARRGNRFCRHHSSEALLRRRSAPPDDDDTAPAPSEALNPFALRAYWRAHHRILRTGDAETVEDTIEMVHLALGSGEISHRSAGRLLALALRRKEQLRIEAEKADSDAMQMQLAALVSQCSSSLAGLAPSENYPVSGIASQKSLHPGILKALETIMS